ncbi:MAG: response regulator [Thermodesulfobacteriota bacterium]|nr:response regulator [Thermodesulfobacteriota bacterium]
MDPFSKIKTMKTLLIEDDELIRDSLSMVFLSKGCFLMAVESAEDGLGAMQNNHFDIIISDFILPGMNGIDFFKQSVINQTDSTNVLIAGNISSEKLSEKNEAKVHDFIQKPFTVTALARTLAILTEKKTNQQNPIENLFKK